jgi:hypothetical protein
MKVFHVYMIWLLAVFLAGMFGVYFHTLLFGWMGLWRYWLAVLWMCIIAACITLGVFLSKSVLF